MSTAAASTTPARPDPLDHQRLVWSVALLYQGRGLDLDDLASEGQFGLLTACERYDPARGNQFSTYAVHWIKQAIRRAIENQGRLIRVPSHLHYETKGERYSADTKDAAERVFRLHVRRDGPSLRLADLVADRGGPAHEPDEHPRDRVGELLGQLDPRRAEVLRLRFGLDGSAPLTHAEIALRVGLSKQRVQQIEVETLTALRCQLDPDFRATRGRQRRRWA